MSRYLAVAHQTSESIEFVEAVRAVADADPDAEFVLLVPATAVEHLATWNEGEARAVAEERAMAARHRLEEEGVAVADARIGDRRPYEAVTDALIADHFDGVIVSTFPPGISRWLGMDLIHRLERSTDIPITHVIAHEP